MNIKGFASSMASLFTAFKGAVSSTSNAPQASTASPAPSMGPQPAADAFTLDTRRFHGPELTGWGFDSAPVLDTAQQADPATDPAAPAATEPPVPEWLDAGQQPQWMKPADWSHIPPEGRQAVLDGIRQRWSERVETLRQDPTLSGTPETFDAYIAEEMKFYFGEVPAGGAPVEAPLIQQTQGSSWGLGRTGEWDTYGVNGDAAQYLNVLEMTGAGSMSHPNLCGQLAVISEVGVSLVDGLTQFAGIDDGYTDGAAILADPEKTTKPFQLEAFLRSYDYTILGEGVPGLDGADHANSNGAPSPLNNSMRGPPTPEQLDTLLEEGTAFFAAVNIEGTRDGMLSPLDNEGDNISHWVRVEDVSRGADGEPYVRVYNSFQNREEVYRWDDFTAAWNQTAGNDPFTYVAATPPSE